MKKALLVLGILMSIVACKKENVTSPTQFSGDYEWSVEPYQVKTSNEQDFSDIVLGNNEISYQARFDDKDSLVTRASQGFGVTNKRIDKWMIKGDSLIVDDFGGNIKYYFIDIKDSIFVNLIGKEDTVYLKKIGKIRRTNF